MLSPARTCYSCRIPSASRCTSLWLPIDKPRLGRQPLALWPPNMTVTTAAAVDRDRLNDPEYMATVVSCLSCSTDAQYRYTGGRRIRLEVPSWLPVGRGRHANHSAAAYVADRSPRPGHALLLLPDIASDLPPSPRPRAISATHRPRTAAAPGVESRGGGGRPHCSCAVHASILRIAYPLDCTATRLNIVPGMHGSWLVENHGLSLSFSRVSNAAVEHEMTSTPN